MRTRLLGLGAWTFLLVGSTVAPAQDTAKATIERAIQAHGGMDRLARHRAEKVKLRGTLFTRDQVIPFAGETTLQMPAQLKTRLEMTAAGQKHVLVQILDGDKISVTQNGQPIKVDPAARAEMRSVLQLQQALLLVPLVSDPSYRLSMAEDVKINDRPAVGVRVVHRGHKDLLLYFDRQLGLLVKSERALDDGRGKEVREERFYGDYKDLGGYIRPTRVIAKRGGKKVMEATLFEVKAQDAIAAAEFKQP